LSTIFLDLNVRDPFVTNSTSLMLEDTKVVVQSVWRLLTTEEGEIPNFRSYGLNIKQFIHLPLTKETARNIGDYVENKIKYFEQRAEVIKNILSADYENETINSTMYIRVRSTGEIVQLPTWSVKIGMV